MLMDGDPSPIAPLEDDALTLEQCLEKLHIY
jgi:hypothetical protein